MTEAIMQTLSIFNSSIQISLRTGPDICDTTRDLQRLIGESNISEGVLNATMVGSTGSLTTIEFEPGVIEDLKRAINSLAPPGAYYAHEEAWHDGNGHSHVQAALLGPSIALPVRGGSLSLGTWQQVVAINHDNRPRKRTIEVSIVGVE
jgi:secondary thiamine-phosphate synthase enzyme